MGGSLASFLAARLSAFSCASSSEATRTSVRAIKLRIELRLHLVGRIGIAFVRLFFVQRTYRFDHPVAGSDRLIGFVGFPDGIGLFILDSQIEVLAPTRRQDG